MTGAAKYGKLKLASAAVGAMMLFCACAADSGKEESEFTAHPAAEAAAVQTTQASESTETTPPPTETTTETTTTTTLQTTTAKPEPAKIKASILDSHMFTAQDFPKKVYSNKKLINAFDEIDDICNSYGYSISFVYKNMDTGAMCSYNQNASYGTCSTIKAPFCKQLLQKGIDLDEKISTSVIWGGDYGTVASAGYGETYTARELIRYAITESDNTAYYNLVNYYGFQSFNEMNYSLGVNYSLGYGWIFTYCTATDLMKQYEDIYKYAENSKRGEWLIKLMQKTDLETQITAQLADKYPVAHKYGSDAEQMAYHDCAICYADSPFVLVIMTNQVPETEDSNKVFKKLAKQFDIVNEQLVTDEKE